MAGNATPAWHRLRSQFTPRPAGARLRPAGVTTGRSSSGAAGRSWRVRGAVSRACRQAVQPDLPDARQPGRCGGSPAGHLPGGAPEARYVSRRLRARHVAVSAGDESVSGLPAEPRRRAASQVTDALDDEPWIADAGSRGLAERTVSKMDLERALAQLPEGCRAAFVLHDIEGLEHREVAEVLGIAEGTSKSQVHKARMRLRTLLRSVDHAVRALHGRDSGAGRRHAGTDPSVGAPDPPRSVRGVPRAASGPRAHPRSRRVARSTCRAESGVAAGRGPAAAGRAAPSASARRNAVASSLRPRRDRRVAAAGRRRIALPSPARSSRLAPAAGHVAAGARDRPGSS